MNRSLAALEKFPPETFCLRQAKRLVGVEAPSGSDWMFSGLWLTPEVVAVGNRTAFPAGLDTMVGLSTLGLPELPELVGSSLVIEPCLSDTKEDSHIPCTVSNTG